MIELQDLSKAYGDAFAVKDLSLTVAKGELCVLIGPSGCGKSTTLRMINRLIPLTSGRIVLNGEDVTTLPPEALRRRMGYVIQSIGLFPHWSVAQNIGVVPRLLGWPKARIDERIEELMALLHLGGELRDKHPHELSGGQAQRVGVARALAADPEVLLMDEPFAAVDPPTREALQTELERIHRETGKTIVFVTHDMDEALRLASRIAIMNRGRLVQYDRPIELMFAPADDFVRDFLGKTDLGLKMLSRRWVRQYERPASGVRHRTDQVGTAQALAAHGHAWLVDDAGRPQMLVRGRDAGRAFDGPEKLPPIRVTPEWTANPDMTMKEALSRMVWQRVRLLPVLDEGGRLAGEVTFEGVMGRRA